MWLGDSWFGRVDTAVEVSEYGRFIGAVENTHSRYPKAWLEEKMKEWSAGSHLVLKAKIEGVKLVAVGYKYNQKKVPCFIATEGAGYTKAGQPYEVTWKNMDCNTESKAIFRLGLVA